jgi:Asp-tRNA(Asn)/Glu-tRNA(Gln) amidotransferase A subunit family amidase
MNDLAYISAGEALDRFRSRDLSPVELMTAVIERSQEVEPRVNAFADEYFEEALELAADAEAAYAPGGSPRPLEGIPLAVKDDTALVGKRSTAGSLLLRDHVDTYTAPSLQRLLDAGAIVHARTTCPEFCWPWVCYSRLHGVTRNPWNLDFTSGASSGGSGAALASGTTILATGTDSAGSIRHPAAMCGVLGFKPPSGRNPGSPHHTFDAYSVFGPMARSAADAMLMQNVTAGPHPLDHLSLPVTPPLKNQADVSGLRIALSMDLDYFRVAGDVERQTRAAAAALTEAGAIVEEVGVPWAGEAIEAAYAYGDHLYADDFADAVSEHGDEVCDYTPFFADLGAEVTGADFHRSHTVAGATWFEHLGPLLQRYDAFLCPTVAMHEVPAELKPWEDDVLEVDGVGIGANDWVMTTLFNMFNRCPVVAAPVGFVDSGMPASVQIAGRPNDDQTVFSITLALEAAGFGFGAGGRFPPL